MLSSGQNTKCPPLCVSTTGWTEKILAQTLLEARAKPERCAGGYISKYHMGVFRVTNDTHWLQKIMSFFGGKFPPGLVHYGTYRHHHSKLSTD